MRKYNKLIKRGWKPIAINRTEIDQYMRFSNILMAKGLERKVITVDGWWELSSLEKNAEMYK